MSFFSDLFAEPLQVTLDKEFALYKNEVYQFIEHENNTLRSFGIEPPRMVSELSYTKEFVKKWNNSVKDRWKIKIVSPKFEFLPCLQISIKSGELTCNIFQNIESAKMHFKWWGLQQLTLDIYNPIWTNRNPFEVYNQLQKPVEESFDYLEAGALSEILGVNGLHPKHQFIFAKKLPKLTKLPALSFEEAAKIHYRAQLYNFIVDYKDRSVTKPIKFYPSNASTDILFDLPFELTNPPYSSIKIFPSGEIKPRQMVEFLKSLHGVIDDFISFELIRENETVYFQLHFSEKSKTQIISKLNLYFPGFEYLEIDATCSSEEYFCRWLQKKSAYDSIRRLRDFQIDPYAHFANAFETATADDQLGYRIIFAPVTDTATNILIRELRYPWLENELKSIVDKLPVWLVSINVGSRNENLPPAMIQNVSKTLFKPNQRFFETDSCCFTSIMLPELLPTFLSVYDTEELAALAHFPISPLPIERLEKTSMKNVKPPESYSGDAAVRIGETKARGQVVPVTIPENVRDRHVYIVGKSGTGKSTIMETIARRDIEAGRGLAVIDPHGDLIQHLLETIPEERVADCILFSPKHFPISLEILSAQNDHEIDLLSDDLITMFRRTSESWGDKMQAILQMAFQTLLRVPGSSFTDISRLLTDEDFRNRLLTKINHPQLESFWNLRYDMKQAEPILIRMDRLTTSGTLRDVLTQNKNSLNFYDVITESKIFLADLSKGFLGESTSHLLGSIIVSQIQLAAMRQAHLPAEQRIPFSLFVDEVQNFVTSAFGTILSEARKQKLRLTIAHQFVSQLPPELQKAVFGNVGTLFFFALSPDDLGAARHELGTFETQDVANLPKYHALCRPVTAARDTFLFATDPPPPVPEKNYTKQIIEQTRREYSSNYQPQPEIIETQAQTSAASKIGFIQPQPIETAPQIQLRPADATPPVFTTNTEKILHYLRQAEYLTQPQIIALTELLPPNASTALKKLCETGQIKSLDDRRPKIYFIGRNCNATAHNILVRDLFVKICASNFEMRSVKFNENLSDLNPDLSIEFVSRNDNTLTPLPAYFELDRGTEGVQELEKKAQRYSRISNNPRVGFIFERESDMLLARKTIQYPFIYYGVLNDFISLRDEAFNAGSLQSPAADTKLPFYR